MLTATLSKIVNFNSGKSNLEYDTVGSYIFELMRSFISMQSKTYTTMSIN